MTQKKTTPKKNPKFEEPKKELSERHEAFIREYLLHYNGTKAYLKIYPDSDYDSARANSSRLIANDNIKERIEHLNKNLEEAAEISRLKVLKEFMNIGFSSFASFQKDWMTKKEFEDLTEIEKACIASISHEVIQVDKSVMKEVVKFKLYDKQRALENINKMLGYNEQQEIEHDIKIEVNIVKPKQ